MKNSEVEKLFSKATSWRDEADALRTILLDSGLDEDKKWGKPCYSYDGKNIAIIQRMKDFLALLFFKGALLNDPDGILQRQGPNSQSGFRVTFTSTGDVARKRKSLKACIKDAIKVEKAGLKVEKSYDIDIPEELTSAFDADPDFKAAFDALTPGRRRGYALHFSEAKQSKTRTARIEKYREKIFDGKGFHDR